MFIRKRHVTFVSYAQLRILTSSARVLVILFWAVLP
jgi:hypothetical protein